MKPYVSKPNAGMHPLPPPSWPVDCTVRDGVPEHDPYETVPPSFMSVVNCQFAVTLNDVPILVPEGGETEEGFSVGEPPLTGYMSP